MTGSCAAWAGPPPCQGVGGIDCAIQGLPWTACLWSALRFGFLFASAAKGLHLETGNAHSAGGLVALGGRTGAYTTQLGALAVELGGS